MKPHRMIDPEEAMTFEPMEFTLTFNVAQETARSNGEIVMVRKEAVDGEASKMASFGVAVARRYGKDRRKFDSFMWRWKAWSQLMISGEIAREFFPVCNDPDRLAQCSLEVAARLPLNKSGSFDQEDFFAALRERLSMP